MTAATLMTNDSDTARSGELEFPRARAQLEAEVESHLSAVGGGLSEVPNFVFERGETKFTFPVAHIDKERVFDALNLIKNHVDHIRVHTLEPGYVIFQDAGNPFSGKITEGIKFKFISISTSHRIEVSRKGNLTQDELQAQISLFKLFHPRAVTDDPTRKLAEIGVQVYRSEEEAPASEAAEEDADAKKAGFVKKHGFAGYKKTKQEVLESVILPLKHPGVYADVAKLARGTSQGTVPRAVLFEGPPGVGKTSMARIIASETGIPMVYVPVENIVSKYYGESAQNMAQIFDISARYDRAILFLDEIDSLAGSREGGLFEATRRILSVLLRKIDGLDSHEGILTIGATNRAQDLDRALLSRFDTIISFPLPNASERASIFRRYARHLEREDLEALARSSDGLSGRSIQDVCEYAERRWARHLIANGGEASAPPAEFYLELAREKSAQSADF